MDVVLFAHKEGDRALITTNINVLNNLSIKDKETLIKSIVVNLNEIFNDYEFFYERKN
jgi:hypothetical protein